MQVARSLERVAAAGPFATNCVFVRWTAGFPGLSGA